MTDLLRRVEQQTVHPDSPRTVFFVGFRGDKCPLRTNSYQALCISDLTPFPAQWNEPGFLIQREGSQISNLHIWFVMGQDRNLVSAALTL